MNMSEGSPQEANSRSHRCVGVSSGSKLCTGQFISMLNACKASLCIFTECIEDYIFYYLYFI